jgi:hypothetical protein
MCGSLQGSLHCTALHCTALHCTAPHHLIHLLAIHLSPETTGHPRCAIRRSAAPSDFTWRPAAAQQMLLTAAADHPMVIYGH